jgi:hypothetical protein
LANRRKNHDGKDFSNRGKTTNLLRIVEEDDKVDMNIWEIKEERIMVVGVSFCYMVVGMMKVMKRKKNSFIFCIF